MRGFRARLRQEPAKCAADNEPVLCAASTTLLWALNGERYGSNWLACSFRGPWASTFVALPQAARGHSVLRIACSLMTTKPRAKKTDIGVQGSWSSLFVNAASLNDIIRTDLNAGGAPRT